MFCSKGYAVPGFQPLHSQSSQQKALPSTVLGYDNSEGDVLTTKQASLYHGKLSIELVYLTFSTFSLPTNSRVHDKLTTLVRHGVWTIYNLHNTFARLLRLPFECSFLPRCACKVLAS